jgi:hypothetical protein
MPEVKADVMVGSSYSDGGDGCQERRHVRAEPQKNPWRSQMRPVITKRIAMTMLSERSSIAAVTHVKIKANERQLKSCLIKLINICLKSIK